MSNYLDEEYWNAALKQRLKEQNKSRGRKAKNTHGKARRKRNRKILGRDWAEFRRQEDHIRSIMSREKWLYARKVIKNIKNYEKNKNNF